MSEFWANGFYLDTLRWHLETWLWMPAVIALAVVGLIASLGAPDEDTGNSQSWLGKFEHQS